MKDVPENDELVTPGEPHPSRRADDQPASASQWTLLLIGILGFAGTFTADLSKYETWAELAKPSAFFLHFGQLATYILTALTAKGMPSGPVSKRR